MAIQAIVIDDEYRVIDCEMLSEGTRLPFDVYARDHMRTVQVLPSGTVVTGTAKHVLKSRGFKELLVSRGEANALERYVFDCQVENLSQKDVTKYSSYSYSKACHYQVDRRLLAACGTINFSLYEIRHLDASLLLGASEDSPANVGPAILTCQGDIVIANRDSTSSYMRLLGELESDIEKAAKFVLNSKYAEDQLPLWRVDTLTSHRVLAEKIRLAVFMENSRLKLRDLLYDPMDRKKIEELKIDSWVISNELLRSAEALLDMVFLQGHDLYTYTHSINVCLWATCIGIAANIPEDELVDLAAGALFHDIGKSTIAPEILDKQGKLTAEEYMVMQRHVVDGVCILRDSEVLPRRALLAPAEHHERISGRGYPFNIAGDGISRIGRITAIADCYDAMTTKRPYKVPLKPFDALKQLMTEKDDLDGQLLQKFIRFVAALLGSMSGAHGASRIA